MKQTAPENKIHTISNKENSMQERKKERKENYMRIVEIT